MLDTPLTEAEQDVIVSCFNAYSTRKITKEQIDTTNRDFCKEALTVVLKFPILTDDRLGIAMHLLKKLG